MKTWHWIVGGGLLAWIFWPDSANAKPSVPAQPPAGKVYNLFVNRPDTYPATARVGDGLTISGATPWTPENPNGVYVNRNPIAALDEVAPDFGLWKFAHVGQVTVVWGPGLWGAAGQAIINVTE